MSITNKIPIWNSPNSKMVNPPSSKINSGWNPGEKPPAYYFNWFWTATSKALEEINNHLHDSRYARISHNHNQSDLDISTHENKDSGIHGVGASEIESTYGAQQKADIAENRAKNYAEDLASDAGVPTGAVIMWTGSTSNIPNGWTLCNGNNGAPNLQNRFVVGAGASYSVGNTGGAISVRLTEEHMPSHSHTGNTSSGGNHRHRMSAQSWSHAGFNYVNAVDTTGSSGSVYTDYNGAHSHSFTTGATGGGSSHENRPPYYALAYIMKI